MTQRVSCELHSQLAAYFERFPAEAPGYRAAPTALTLSTLAI